MLDLHTRLTRHETTCPRAVAIKAHETERHAERIREANRVKIKRLERLALEQSMADLADRIDKLRADAMILADIAEILEAKRHGMRRELAQLNNGEG